MTNLEELLTEYQELQEKVTCTQREIDNHLIAAAELQGKIQLARMSVVRMAGIFNPKAKVIEMAVAMASKQPITSFHNGDRSWHYVILRQFCMWAIRKYLNETLDEIGRYYRRTTQRGRVVAPDHGTVLHAIRKINNLLDVKDKQIMALKAAVEDALQKETL